MREQLQMNKKTRELLRENNLLEEQLGDEYRSVLTDIVVYLRSADITFLRQERIRRDITDMFLDGEQRAIRCGTSSDGTTNLSATTSSMRRRSGTFGRKFYL